MTSAGEVEEAKQAYEDLRKVNQDCRADKAAEIGRPRSQNRGTEITTCEMFDKASDQCCCMQTRRGIDERGGAHIPTSHAFVSTSRRYGNNFAANACDTVQEHGRCLWLCHQEQAGLHHIRHLLLMKLRWQRCNQEWLTGKAIGKVQRGWSA